jgi:nicotinate-nucleotide adenylyltransferase
VTRLGILGGTFDPPHLGHLILAELATDSLELERVLFAPTGEPPHKHAERITPIADRLAMVERAIAGNPRFGLSRVDIDRPGPHFTVDALDCLCREYPDHDLYFILGEDSLHDLINWKDPAGIVARAKLAVMRRSSGGIEPGALAAQVPGIMGRMAVISAPFIGISATTLRERVRAGRSIRYQVPEAVAAYIATHCLYREG